MILYRGRTRSRSRDQKLNMNEEEITKLFFTDPDQFFWMIQKNGGDLGGLRKLKKPLRSYVYTLLKYFDYVII